MDDASRLAEILVFAKRTAYRSIFRNDKVSFGEMQVLPLALAFLNDPGLLENTLVFDDEFVKGMINTNGITDKDGTRILEIKELYVDPFFQGDGIGGKLLSAIQTGSQSRGTTAVFLWVLEKNEKARKFYEKHGFILTDEREPEEGTAEFIVKYVKKM